MGGKRKQEELALRYDAKLTAVTHALERVGDTDAVLEASLTQFFEVLPSPKRLKISDDAWRTVNEFAADHRFVYPVGADSFEKLQDKDQQIADLLVSFCARSSGQYALYLTGLSCSYSKGDDAADARTDVAAALTAPWLKRGDETKQLMFSPTHVNHLRELVPAGYLETIDSDSEEEEQAEEEDEEDEDGFSIFISGYHDGTGRTVRRYDGLGYIDVPVDGDDESEDDSKTRELNGYALVVQPTALEHVLWAKMPVAKVMVKLQELVQTYPPEASRLARRFLSNEPRWVNTDASFSQFLTIVRTLDDAPLFCDLLLSVSAFKFDGQKRIVRAVNHFGWDACIATIERIIQATDFRSRANLICSVLQGSTSSDRIHRLIEQLIPTDTKVVSPYSSSRSRIAPPQSARFFATDVFAYPPSVDECSRVFALAHRASLATLTLVLEVRYPQYLNHTLIIPSLVQFVKRLSANDRSPLVPMLRSIHDKIKSLLPELRSASYMACTIPSHCDKCHELQEFLRSTVRQISVPLRDKTHLKHIETVVKRKVSRAGAVSVTHAPPIIVLTKEDRDNDRSVDAQRCVASLAALIK